MRSRISGKVKVTAKNFLFLVDRLDILVCNAGTIETPPGITTDCYEVQFGTNHLGHALLIQKLLPTLLKIVDTNADLLPSSRPP